MARLTVTVEGEAEEVREALLHLVNGEPVGLSVTSSGSSPGPQPTRADVSNTSPEPSFSWTEEELARLWDDLTYSARRVLGEVAQQPEGYPMQDLEQALGSDMRRIGGNLSSVGHAMRRLYRIGDSYTKPWPVVGDGYKRVYRMDEGVAATIRELAARTGEEDAGRLGGDPRQEMTESAADQL